MTKDERAILKLAAEALRNETITAEARGVLADALERIAGVELGAPLPMGTFRGLPREWQEDQDA